MLNLVSFFMKKVLFSLVMLVSVSASAQIYSDGTVIQSFSATDINNNVFSSTIATNNGKHIIIDFSATWCGHCWTYHNSKVLERYYAKFGPNGTDAQDAEVLFYEADASTNSNDLTGVGTNTVGDWVMGTSYTIFNETNVTPVRSSFSNGGSMGFPSVFLVTADKKMYKIPTNIRDEDLLRDFVNQKAGLTPLSINSVNPSSFDYEFYPNPTNGNLTFTLNLDKSQKASYQVYNSVGQLVVNQDLGLRQGQQKTSIDLSSYPTGLYFVTANIGGEGIREKIVLQK